jgi:hypothetical protein
MINPPYPDCLVGRGASACRPVQTTTKAAFKNETLAQSPDIARTSLAIASSVASEPVRSMKAWHLRRPRIRSAPSSAARSLPKAVVRKQDARRLKIRRKRLLSLQSAMAAVSRNADGIWRFSGRHGLADPVGGFQNIKRSIHPSVCRRIMAL